METASIRIKFTPLLKTIKRGESKCCLEIVPEVSAIDNLDKIEWKQNDDLIEYNIPMTYKILIKKQHEFGNKSTNEIAKIYHSCVDLLHTYSFANADSACGDISRIISDTFIFSKITSNSEQCKVINKDNVQNLKTICDTDPKTARLQAIVNKSSFLCQLSETKVSEAVEQKNNTMAVHKVTRQDDSFFYSETGVEIVDYTKESVEMSNHEKILTSNNGDIGLKELDNAIDSELEYVSDIVKPDKNVTISEPIIQDEAKSKRELSLSPICSINTYDDYASSICKKSNASSFIFHNSTNTLTVKDNSTTCSNLTNRKNICDIIFAKIATDCSESYTNCSNWNSPAMRVAYFVNVMEKEIFPLKLLLNEIRGKCQSLGLLLRCSEKNNLEQNDALYKNIKCDTHICRRKTQKSSDNHQGRHKKFLRISDARVTSFSKNPESNRVVYSVVFDG